jgi:glutathione synthase
MNAAPLRFEGRIAAVARTRAPGDPDMRSNLTAGGVIARAEVDDELLALAERLRPRLIEDGIFLAGIDVAGGKIMEVNIMTPGTLRHAEMLEGVNFSRAIVRALERKVDHLHSTAQPPGNVELATF